MPRLKQCLLYLGLWLQAARAATDASTFLWYDSPAEEFNEALPIGNGRLGGMVYGYTESERIGLNEDSLWSGAFQDRINPDSVETIPKVMDAFDSGNITEAGNLWLAGMASNPTDLRAYQPLCDLILDFGHSNKSVTSYNRSLDLTTGNADVHYDYKNQTHYRQAIANYPSGVLAMKLWSSQPGGTNFNMSLTRTQNLTSVSADEVEGTITLKGTSSKDNSIDFTAQAKVWTKNGKLIPWNGASLQVQNADEVWIFFNAETSWRYPDQDELISTLESKLEDAVEKEWEGVYNEALEDYQSLYDRVFLDLGNSGPPGQISTKARVTNWRHGQNYTNDVELMTLVFNYGRYLLIGSSREGTLPANLQGIWNEDFEPYWDSKFTMNINLEMNYWPAETTNLQETVPPLVEFLKIMQTRGQDVARDMYNMTGFVCHHNTDIWGDCGTQANYTFYSPWPMGAAWVSLHLVERYRFGGDQDFAADVTLPILKDVMAFFYDFLILEDGYYVTPYGMSPENSYYIPHGEGLSVAGMDSGFDRGPTMDRAILHELFTGFIELSEAISSTDGVPKAKEYLSKIRGPQIGKKLGQIMEWSQDFEEKEIGHRHLSHLFGLHPGTLIHPLVNETISNAALVSLDRRMENGSGGTGWSAAWVISLYARLLEREKTWYYAARMLEKSIYNNLFDANGVFQIDGNSGFTSGITEALMQSHLGVVHIGAALPERHVPVGSVRGLVARGGFVVGFEWVDHSVTRATVESTRGGVLNLRVQDGLGFKVDGVEYTEPIDTVAGEVYTIVV
ncbi:hypothetical protein FQN54_006219 [Arachnomyces sp. PD_36]|nr:hypothetical protein FQN54_006219 [Arachnomyces sp. PD_36]